MSGPEALAREQIDRLLLDSGWIIRDNQAAWTGDCLWDAFAVTTPDRVKGRSQAGRFADLVSLVRFGIEQQPVLKPFADSLAERFDAWLEQRDTAALDGSPLERGGAQRRGALASSVSPGSLAFSAEQLAWLHLIRDHVATNVTVESDDFDFAPFAQRGGLGRAHQLFGAQPPTILDELNARLVA